MVEGVGRSESRSLWRGRSGRRRPLTCARSGPTSTGTTRAPVDWEFTLRQIGQEEPQVACRNRSEGRSLSAVELLDRQPSVQVVVDQSRHARVSLGIADPHARLLRVTS